MMEQMHVAEFALKSAGGDVDAATRLLSLWRHDPQLAYDRARAECVRLCWPSLLVGPRRRNIKTVEAA